MVRLLDFYKILLLTVLLAVVFPLGSDSAFAIPKKGTVIAENGMVVSSHFLATQIGLETLKAGGNAIDASVAVAFALAVVLPSAGNIGGGGFLVYRDFSGHVTTIDFREKAPLTADKNLFLNKDGEIKNRSNHSGGLSIGVPGTVAGLYLAHKRYGRLPWKNLLKPVIKLARDGFRITENQSLEMERYQNAFSRYPETMRKMLKKDGLPYGTGELWVQPELAGTLELISRKGPDGFYKGVTAEKIVKTVQKYGGIMTLKDLESYGAIERPPVRGTYKGFDIYSMGPPSSGGIAIIEILNILEGYGAPELKHNSSKYLHYLTEAMRLAFLDRARYTGDPDYNLQMPLKRLLSKEYADSLRATINPTKAGVSVFADVAFTQEGADTTHFSIVDKYGNAVSFTYTLEQRYGSRIVVEGSGFFLNNEMGDFNPIPGLTDESGLIGTRPNLVEPGKRMLSSMSPTIVVKDEDLLLVLGTPGGRTIINTVVQIVLNIIEFKMAPGSAVDAGRIHHQWLPDRTWIETDKFDENVLLNYRSMGHEVKGSKSQGKAMVIQRDPHGGTLTGISDRRSPDGAADGH